MLLASHQHSHLPADVHEGKMAANSPLHQFMVYFRDCRVIAKTGHTIVVVYIIVVIIIIVVLVHLAQAST